MKKITILLMLLVCGAFVYASADENGKNELLMEDNALINDGNNKPNVNPDDSWDVEIMELTSPPVIIPRSIFGPVRPKSASAYFNPNSEELLIVFTVPVGETVYVEIMNRDSFEVISQSNVSVNGSQVSICIPFYDEFVSYEITISDSRWMWGIIL